MFINKIDNIQFISDFKQKLAVVHNLTKLERKKKYSQLLQILAAAGNDFDSANEVKLAQETTKILDILTSNINSEQEITNHKIASLLRPQISQDIIEIE